MEVIGHIHILGCEVDGFLKSDLGRMAGTNYKTNLLKASETLLEGSAKLTRAILDGSRSDIPVWWYIKYDKAVDI